MSRGHVRRRGLHSWELKFDVGCGPDGKRKIQYVAFRGSKRDAQAKLTQLLAAVGQGDYVEPSKVTVADFVRGRVNQWEAAGAISARTAQRYRQLLKNQIEPHIGAKLLQKLTRLDVEGWHTTLCNNGKVRGKGGLAPRTIGHAHRVLGKALRDAEKDNLVVKNATELQRAPKATDEEMVIVQDVPGLVAKLSGFRLRV